MANVYYDPGAFGLEVVKELDNPNADYFDKFVVWLRKEDGLLFYGTDSGCSCPSPFESVSSVQELMPLKDMKAFEQELAAWGDRWFDAQERQAVVDKVHIVKLYKCTLLG